MPMCLYICVLQFMCVQDSCWDVTDKKNKWMHISCWYLAKTDCYRKHFPYKTSNFFPPLVDIICTSDFCWCYILFCIKFVYAYVQATVCVFANMCTHLSAGADRLCVCFPFSSPLSSPLFLPLVLFCLSFVMERGRLEIKEASRETEWAVTLCDAICYPQRIASGRVTCSIHLSTLALIKQMPVDIWLSRNEFLPLWAGDLLALSPCLPCDLLGPWKHTYTHTHTHKHIHSQTVHVPTHIKSKNR